MFLILCCFCQRKQERETVRNTGRADNIGVQKLNETDVLPSSSVETRENALKVFTIEIENVDAMEARGKALKVFTFEIEN